MVDTGPPYQPPPRLLTNLHAFCQWAEALLPSDGKPVSNGRKHCFQWAFVFGVFVTKNLHEN
jgi:hypothetical protein